MNQLKNIGLFILLSFGLLISCSEDDLSTVPDGITLNAPVNLSSAEAGSTIAITGDNAPLNVIMLSWDQPSVTNNGAVKHYVQLDKAGNNFANPVLLTETNTLSTAVTGARLNEILANMGVLPGANQAIEVRVNSTADGVNFLSSNVLTFNASPYDPNGGGAFLYIAEGYPDWNFLTAKKLMSPNDDGIYGSKYYIFPEATSFKLVDQAGNVWGAGDAYDGQFVINGNSIVVENAGMYDFQVNPGGESFTFMQLVWGIIGDATPQGWGDETVMDLDLSTGIWSITANLNAPAEMKFRANHTWDINLGDNGFDGSLEPGGANIPVSVAGDTRVILDLSDPMNPTYQVGDSEPVEPVDSGNLLFFSTDGGSTTTGMENIYSVDGDGNFAGFAYLTTGNTYSLVDPELENGAVQETVTVDSDALYKVTVDLMNNTVNLYKIDSWGIIGPASPTAGWDNDENMSFDPMAKTISGTVTLSAGEFKFRANDEWTVNLGDNDADGTMEQDGANIVNTTAGTYNISIDLTDDTNYTYTIQ